ncbi:H-NS histone family protein [Caballeronia sp. BR00000012568055]|uniref:H-NS histone family protein n=1 Tax=Caballeronia sp. BR00000012568055 TaxID=2918761 RepID=UPI0023F63454|nr:H-NS histone family protein [Caballeronia sp. BR00000012568055]
MAYQSIELAQLLAKQEELDKQLADAKARETRVVLLEIVQKMREYNISLNELMGRKTGAKPAVESVAAVAAEPVVKYREPVTGATWSGRGRAPHWIAGKNRDDFLVDQAGSSIGMVQPDLFSGKH